MIVDWTSSCQLLVTSDFSQNSVLVQILFNTSISDLNVRMKYIINKFVDNNKLGGAVDFLGGHNNLKQDLDTFEHCTIINGMKFNWGKSGILHLQ